MPGSSPWPRHSGAPANACPRSVYAALLAGSEKGLTLRDNVDAFDEIRFAPRTAGPRRQAKPRHDGAGPADRVAGCHLAHRCAGRASGRGGRRGPGGRRPRHRHGPEFLRQQADRAGGGGQPEDSPAAVLDRRPRRHDPSRRTGPRRRRGRTDPHPRLVVLAQSRLGQPAHPRAPHLPGACPPRPARPGPSPLAAAVPAHRPPARPHRAQHGRGGSTGADVLRRVRPVDADPATDLGRRPLAARTVGRTVPAQGRHPGR